MPASPDPISVVETAYQLDLVTDEWLDQLGKRLEDCARGCRGVYAQTFHFDPSTGLDIERWHNVSLSDELFQVVNDVQKQVETEELAYAPPGVIAKLGSEIAPPEEFEEVAEPVLSSRGLEDVLGLRATEPDGSGVFFGLLLEEQSQPRPEVFWYRLAVHIGAGFRLRNALDRVGTGGVIRGCDAILEADGRLCDASDDEAQDKREILRDAVRRIDRARGPCRDHHEKALDLWEGLVDGRWSLIDSFDDDGRRYVVARRNDPDIRHPTALTRRERQVVCAAGLGHSDGEIAYSLGISPSTVGTHLWSAMNKLGVERREEIVAMLVGLTE